MNSTTLEREFASRAVPHAGRLLLLRYYDAIDLVRRAQPMGVPIIGIDGMLLGDQGTESPIEHLADFSIAVAQGDGSWAAAQAFIEARRSLGMVFEVVLGKQQVPAA